MEITVNDAKKILDDTENETIFVDVRELDEYQFCSIQPSLHFPLSSLGETHNNLPKDMPLVIYCHHGMRSLKATQFLREQGLTQTVSMHGGIDLWSRKIDSKIPRY